MAMISLGAPDRLKCSSTSTFTALVSCLGQTHISSNIQGSGPFSWSNALVVNCAFLSYGQPSIPSSGIFLFIL